MTPLRIFGIPVRFHFTFLVLAAYLIISGIQGGASAVASAIYIGGMFASVLLHEFGHAAVARRYGIRTIEIVLYPIGGVARMERGAPPAQELWIALAGPAVNVLIMVGLMSVVLASHQSLDLAALSESSEAGMVMQLAAGNLILVLFNMIPAYPMDGGRVLRALLARWTGDDAKSTKWAANTGRVFAVLMGLYGLANGQYTLIFIALFIYMGATQETVVVEGRSLTHGVPVSMAMITDYRTLSHGNSIREAANLLLATSQQDFPVVLGEQVVGLLGRTALLQGMAADGPDAYVAGIMERNFPRVHPTDDLEEALPVMANSNCALVMDGEQLVGLLTRENLSEFMTLRKFGMQQTARA